MFCHNSLEQAAQQVALRHDPEGLGMLHIDRIPQYLQEMAQLGCPRLLCNQIIMVQVVEDLLDCKVNFGVADLINVYRFIEKHQQTLSNPPAETTYEERVNPDGSITKITVTHSTETHVGLPVGHHHVQPPTTTVFVENQGVSVPQPTVYSHVQPLYNQPVLYQEPVTVLTGVPVVTVVPTVHVVPSVHPVGSVTHITGSPHFVAPGTVVTSTTTTSEIHPGV